MINEKDFLCSVCQDKAVNPVKLPCSHIFCFLCVKGLVARSRVCALCRTVIPANYLDSPCILDDEDLDSKLKSNPERYHWFYEGRNGGWWMYEEKTSDEIEKGYGNHESSIKIRVAGFMYVVDYEKMLQSREDRPERKRRIKRDVVQSDDVKGVAGLYVGR